MIKSYIYITGLFAAAFIIGWLSALYLGSERHWLMAIGVLVFLPVYLYLVFRKRKEHKKRMEKIIREYREKGEQVPAGMEDGSRGKGWSMNNSPFRDRKAGVEWGGGNIHAAGATRRSRK